ncbi:MAG: hypothetical protein QG588_1969 [Candidatus Poribacteria bacterium]|nr:hypothetical protein [Candidatus Poribacteria bacterium]
MSKVLILDCENYESVEDKIGKVFDTFPHQWKGKNVLVKPNMLNGRSPEQGVTTHPTVVKAVTKWLIDAGANITVGDNPGAIGSGANERCAEGTGIADASMGHYKNISQEPVNVEIKSKFVKQVVVSKPVIDSDILISLPKFKTHSLTQITGAIKNSFGFLIGGDKGRIHAISGNYKSFVEVLVDIYQIRLPDLVIMDAVIGMEGNGPSGGDLRQIGKIMASDDGVAIDAVMTHIMGKRPEKIYMLKVAKQRGIGEIDLQKMEIIGNSEPIKGFKMPATFFNQFAGRLYNNKIIQSFVWSKPFITKGKCKGCGICEDSCPVKAIKMSDKYPVINRKACIRCYCCQELCPNDAVELKRFA